MLMRLDFQFIADIMITNRPANTKHKNYKNKNKP